MKDKTYVPRISLERVFFIDREIAGGGFPNTAALAEKWGGVSISTISRDIDYMRNMFNAPIEYNAARRGYFYSEKTYRLPAGFTTAEEMLALGLAKNLLSVYRETPLYAEANRLLESISSPLGSAGEKLADRIIVPPIAAAKVDQGVWDAVVEGLRDNRVLRFEYRGAWDKDYRGRHVRPYQLLFDAGVWMLYGYAEERKAPRMFSLPRIKNAALTGAGFSLPQNYRYSDAPEGSYFGVFIGQEKLKFSVDCYDEAAVYATERRWAADQKITAFKDGGINLSFSSSQYDKVLSWILSNGADAAPRKPARLVQDWKREVSLMAKEASHVSISP